MAPTKLNQRLKSQINELKSLANNTDTPIIFYLDNISFDVDEVIDFTDPIERIITGRIFPNSDLYKQGAFEIEIKLPRIYPLDPPKIRFITPIYHPNVGPNGEFQHEFLMKTARWMNTASLVDVVKVIVERIDDPDAECLINQEVAEEYIKNPNEFNRKALEMIEQHALPRN